MMKKIHRVVLALALLCFPFCSDAQTNKRDQILAHYKRAEAALADGQPATAADEFEAILKLDPKNSEAYANLGVISYRAGDFRRAQQLFGDALKCNPSLWDAKAFLGLSEVRAGDNAVGESLIEEAFPHIRNESVKLEAGVAIIKYHEESKSLGAIVTVIRDLEESMPNNPEVLYVAYRAYSELAAESLSALSRRAPDSARVHQVLAEAAFAQDNFPDAIAQFRKAIEIDSTLPGVHYELGLALITNSQDATARQEAQHEFETELKSDPSDFHSEYELGETFRLGTNLQLAEEHYGKALKLRPDFADAQVGMGNVLADQGRPEEAITHFIEACRLDPNNETAHYKLARTYRAVGRTKEADSEMATFERLHQMHDSHEPKPSAGMKSGASEP